MSDAVYWTCRKCNHIGVVYPPANASIYSILENIDGDHADATDGETCKLDLAQLSVSPIPGARHKAAEREADREECSALNT
jgi:hypothetical protein